MGPLELPCSMVSRPRIEPIWFSLIGFFCIHIFQVATQGFFNQMRSMITGWYRPGEHEGGTA